MSDEPVDDWEAERLWKAADVARFLQVRRKEVYALPIPRVQVSKRRVRWQPAAVREYVRRREG